MMPNLGDGQDTGELSEIWSLTSPLVPTNVLIRLENPAARQSLATRRFSCA